MCTLKSHICRECHMEYNCFYPNWGCSTINDDEDGLLCDACIDIAGEMMQAWIDSGEIIDSENKE